MKPNLYHLGFLPKGVDKDKLHRWPFIYLDGKAEAPSYTVDPPDIFMADTPFEEIDDGWAMEATLHMNEEQKDAAVFIWSYGEMKWEKGKVIVTRHERKGLVVLFNDEEAFDHASKHCERKDHCL